MSRTNVHAANARSLRAAAVRLRRGELVAFPTETVYGLGANALDEKAVAKIFEAKGRPRDNPMIVHVNDMKMLRKVAKTPPPRAKALLARFWPGPLTLILSKKSSVPSSVTAGLATVAVRMPQGLARDLVRLAGVPIAAPSANLSGRPSPTTAAHVADDFPEVFVLDGGPTKHGLESTVIALDPPRILREGAIPGDLLRKMIPGLRFAASSRPRSPGSGAFSSKVNEPVAGRRRTSTSGAAAASPDFLSKKIFGVSSDAAQSPGTKYKHYAPSRPLILFRRKEDLAAYFASHPQSLVVCPASLSSLFPKQRFLSLGNSSEEIARALFAALRTRRRGSELLVLAVPRRGLGRTIMDRLERAATRIV
ncbi:MAG TPA: L-threonylcarbamoyladenylate synthase [Thermoanaerobaculia bacterium]|nr:L-threonylcarbamoyladenylate synthase [Thermoanaerobaculia bacterium]